MPIDKSIQKWYNNNRNGEGITPKNQKGIITMRKMIIAGEKTINYKPCLDGRDVKTTGQMMEAIARYAESGDVSTVTELEKELITLNERNDKANRNESYINSISNFIVNNTDRGDVLCENETYNDVYDEFRRTNRIQDVNDNDTSLFILTRAALYRLAESGILEKTRARVYQVGGNSWDAKPRVAYIVKGL